MAVWQFDLIFLPQAHALPASGEAGVELPWLDGGLAEQARVWLQTRLGAPVLVAEGWLLFGDENGDRVELLQEEDGGAGLTARLDAREDAPGFRAALCELADRLGCRFFSAELARTVEPQPLPLLTALLQSRAAAYARDPREVLRGH